MEHCCDSLAIPYILTLTSNKEHDWTPIKHLNVWITIKHKSSCNNFFLIYCINITNFLFWVFWTCLTTSIKKDVNLWKLWHLSAYKKWTSFLTSFLRYCKDITNLLLWVIWECLIMPINNDGKTLQKKLMPKVFRSTCRKLWYLSACKKSTSSLTSFLKYC